MYSIDFIREIVNDSIYDDSVIISSCGNISRELWTAGDREGNFYMVGAMGGASSFGLGIAIVHPDKEIIVLDGDGSSLMRLGNYVSANDYGLPNLFIIVLDNGCFNSTGGQPTVHGLRNFLYNIEVVKVNKYKDKYERPKITLEENYNRLCNFLRK